MTYSNEFKQRREVIIALSLFLMICTLRLLNRCLCAGLKNKMPATSTYLFWQTFNCFQYCWCYSMKLLLEGKVLRWFASFNDSSRINKSSEAVDDFYEELWYARQGYTQRASRWHVSARISLRAIFLVRTHRPIKSPSAVFWTVWPSNGVAPEGYSDRSRSSPRLTSCSHVTTSRWREMCHRLHHHHRNDDC